jgi:hypothetical protein
MQHLKGKEVNHQYISINNKVQHIKVSMFHTTRKNFTITAQSLCHHGLLASGGSTTYHEIKTTSAKSIYIRD